MAKLKTTDPEPTYMPGERTLHPNDAGPDVEAVQRALGVEPVDAIYGEATEAAVKRLQRLRGLPQQGTVGPATWPYLLAAPPVEVVVGPTAEEPG